MNTPIREYPYRDILIYERKEFQCIVLKKEDNKMHIQLDDEKAGDQNGLILTVNIIQ
jgi:hypothetical protein